MPASGAMRLASQRSRAIGRQLNRGWFIPELLLPVSYLFLILGRLEPIALPKRIIPVLNGKGRQRRNSAQYRFSIVMGQFAITHPERPFVRDNMVHVDEQHMVVRANGEQRGPKQPILRKVE